jgi:hypothetical protein
MKYLCIVAVLRWAMCHAWNGILMDGDASAGSTQLVFPNAVPHTVGSVNFGLPHLKTVAVVLPDGNVYFIGGVNYAGVFISNVTRFNSNTNTTTIAAPMITPRGFHAATVVGNQIIACGGQCVHILLMKTN